jgi:hypothetical protein
MLHHTFRIEGGTEPCPSCELGIATFITIDGERMCRRCLEARAEKHTEWAGQWAHNFQAGSSENSQDTVGSPSRCSEAASSPEPSPHVESLEQLDLL